MSAVPQPPDPDAGASARRTAPIPVADRGELSRAALLETSYQALATARTLPDIATLIDLAEAIRVAARAAHLGVDHRRAGEWALVASIPEAALGNAFARANKAGRLVSISTVLRMAVEEQAAEPRRADALRALPLPDGMQLRISDARRVLADVLSNSVALIVTDPPWHDCAEPLYHWLGEWAARPCVPQ